MTHTGGKNPVNRTDRFAEAVSNIFHPFVVAIPTMVIAMLWQGADLLQSLLWTLLAVCIVIVPILLMIFLGVRSGRYSDPSVSIREQRHNLYIVSGLLFALLLAILVWKKAPNILIACLVSALLATVIASLINIRFTKLSLHSIGMAGYTTVLLLTVPVLGIVMVLFAPLVGWSRIRLKHHTPIQILVGWMVSVFSVLIVFHMFHLFL